MSVSGCSWTMSEICGVAAGDPTSFTEQRFKRDNREVIASESFQAGRLESVQNAGVHQSELLS